MSNLVNPHDALFRALVDNPEDAGTLIREHLPAEFVSKLSDAPPVLEDATFVDARLRGTQSDRLYRVTMKDGRPAFLYTLLEHKSVPDPRTPLQLLGYISRTWQRYAGKSAEKNRRLPPIIPLVIYHGKVGWSIPTSVVDCLDANADMVSMLRDFRYTVRDLGHIDDDTLSAVPHVRAVLLAFKHVGKGEADREILVKIVSLTEDGTLLQQQTVRYILARQGDVSAELWHGMASRRWLERFPISMHSLLP